MAEEDETFEVEEIRDSQIMPRSSDGELIRYWLIKWKNYGEDANTWEPLVSIGHLDIFPEFEARRKAKEKRARHRFESEPSASESSFSPEPYDQNEKVVKTKKHKTRKANDENSSCSNTTMSASPSITKTRKKKKKMQNKKKIKLVINNKKRKFIQESDDDSSDAPIMSQPFKIQKNQKKKMNTQKMRHSQLPKKKRKKSLHQKQKCNRINVSSPQKPRIHCERIPKLKTKPSSNRISKKPKPSSNGSILPQKRLNECTDSMQPTKKRKLFSYTFII